MADDPASGSIRPRAAPLWRWQGKPRMTLGHDDFLANIEPASVQALVEGRHGDPFGILGEHPVDGGSVIRVLMPGALLVEVLARETGHPLTRLQRVHAAGLFVGRLDRPVAYRLRIHWPDAVQETEDPYSFGLLLGDLDLHLIAQGTHYELSYVLGAQPIMVDGVSGVRFAVWAPNARRASVIGDFNSWDGR